MKLSMRYRGRIRRLGEEPAVFHCMSRVVAGQKLLRRREKEVFRRMMRKQAAFCGVEILTYAVMSNHFHILVRVVPGVELSDAELLRRVRILYDEETARAVEGWLADEEKGPKVRARLVKRMNDVSFFLKELKQRFSIWYNRRHERYGTLWAEKFKSVLVESKREVLAKVAAYVDLNPVRAGLCTDPKDYRFCGYGEAVGGGEEGRAGLLRLYGLKEWGEAQRAYRLLLFGAGYHTEMGKGRIREGALRKVWEEEGRLSLADALRCRGRYFSEGMAIGSAAFVERVFLENRKRYWSKRKAPGRKLAGSDWGDLYILNRMKSKAGD